MFQKSVINSIKRDENFITFKLIKKEIDSMVQISQEEIRAHVSKHLEVAERLAWEQIDGIRHSDGYYNLDNYVRFLDYY